MTSSAGGRTASPRPRPTRTSAWRCSAACSAAGAPGECSKFKGATDAAAERTRRRASPAALIGRDSADLSRFPPFMTSVPAEHECVACSVPSAAAAGLARLDWVGGVLLLFALDFALLTFCL